MKQEAITTQVASWLKQRGWNIVSRDCPQSGGGLRLRPSGTRHKNRGTIIPDILACRGSDVLVVEVNTRCTRKDVRSLEKVRAESYLQSLQSATKVAQPRIWTAFATHAGVRLKPESLSRLLNAHVDLLISAQESGDCSAQPICGEGTLKATLLERGFADLWGDANAIRRLMPIRTQSVD